MIFFVFKMRAFSEKKDCGWGNGQFLNTRDGFCVFNDVFLLNKCGGEDGQFLNTRYGLTKNDMYFFVKKIAAVEMVSS